jgi:hypothetical protein
VQELGGTKIEVDRSLLESGTGEQNGGHLLATLLKAMEECMENYQKTLMHPAEATIPLISFCDGCRKNH